MKLKTVTLQAMDGSIKIIKNVEGVYKLNAQSVIVVIDNNGGETYYNNFRLVNQIMQVSERERKI